MKTQTLEAHATEGWFTEHPVTGKPIHVVLRENYDMLLSEIAGNDRTIEQLVYEKNDIIAVCRRLIESTAIDGQRYSLYPSCGAWAELEAAIDKAV